MSLQFILGSGLIGYAIGALIEEERRQAVRSLGAGRPSSGTVLKSYEKYKDEVARAKAEARQKYVKADSDRSLTSSEKKIAKRKAFDDFFEKVKRINRGLKADANLYEAHLDDLCVVLKNLASAKKSAEENPETTPTNVQAMEKAFRGFAQGLLMPSEVEELLKRCYGEKPPLTAGYIRGLLPNPSTLDLAAVPTPAIRPFAAAPLRPPVATPSVRRVPLVQPPAGAPQVLPPVPTVAPEPSEFREEVATPGGGARQCGPLERWVEGMGCMSYFDLIRMGPDVPTPGSGGYAPAAQAAPVPASPAPMPTYAPTPTLGVRLGPVPLRRLL
jgi:hypothetical protein